MARGAGVAGTGVTTGAGIATGGVATGAGVAEGAGGVGGAPSTGVGGPNIIMLGFGGSSSLPALPAFAPVSVSGIGWVRTGIRLRWASASAVTASAATRTRPDTTRRIILCNAVPVAIGAPILIG